MHAHLIGDEIQTALDCALSLHLILLQQNRSDELVNLLAILELVELLRNMSAFRFLRTVVSGLTHLLHTEVLLLLSFQFLTRLDSSLEFW